MVISKLKSLALVVALTALMGTGTLLVPGQTDASGGGKDDKEQARKVGAVPLSKQQQALAKSLDWLARAQHKDGYWEGNGGNYPGALTALAGLALLMEGSTPFEGRFQDELKRAVSWLIAPGVPGRKDGLLRSKHPSEGHRYMYAHGFALLFLANVSSRCAAGEKPPPPRDVEEMVQQDLLQRLRHKLRKDLEPVLKRAVDFSVKAQNHRGGWYYV